MRSDLSTLHNLGAYDRHFSAEFLNSLLFGTYLGGLRENKLLPIFTLRGTPDSKCGFYFFLIYYYFF